MDPRLLRAYNDELEYLREAAREFGTEHEVVAGYLGLKTPSNPDPYVERLLEGVAFLAARVNLKLQDQFPEFTQHLLQAVQPNYLVPTPSMCVVALEPEDSNDSLSGGIEVPRESEISAKAPGYDTPVRFRTGHPVTLYPLKIEESEYLSSRTAVARFASAANVRAEAGIRIRVSSIADIPLSRIRVEDLPIYLDGVQSTPGELYRQLLGDAVAVIACPNGEVSNCVRIPLPEQFGFSDDQSLLPNEGMAFRGYRVLMEYFACPERFLFVNFSGLGRAAARSATSFDVVILLKRSAGILANAISAKNFVPFATPAVNLFEMQLGRVTILPYEHEYALVPDRTKPLDFEVYRVLKVEAHAKSGNAKPVLPLYAIGSALHDWREAIYYVGRVLPRRMSIREKRRRSRADYVGSETYLSLTCPHNSEVLGNLRELSVRALVTNRELPEMFRFGAAGSEFKMEDPSVRAVALLRAPTRPRPALGTGDAAWRVIGHLTASFGSLLSASGKTNFLRNHLALYGQEDDPQMRGQVDSILELTVKQITRRVFVEGQSAFARGSQVKVILDDSSFENSRMFLFATIVDRFLGEFSAVNSFVETAFESREFGEFARWPPRIGLRPTI